MSELNLKYNPDPICPYCGGVMSDAWEINFGPCLDGSAIAACGHCGAEFSVERNVDVTYSTAKMPVTGNNRVRVARTYEVSQ